MTAPRPKDTQVAEGLDAAWAEAEAADYARPARQPGDGIHVHADAGYYCACVRGLREDRVKVIHEATGPTPTAALRALTRSLLAGTSGLLPEDHSDIAIVPDARRDIWQTREERRRSRR